MLLLMPTKIKYQQPRQPRSGRYHDSHTLSFDRRNIATFRWSANDVDDSNWVCPRACAWVGCRRDVTGGPPRRDYVAAAARRVDELGVTDAMTSRQCWPGESVDGSIDRSISYCPALVSIAFRSPSSPVHSSSSRTTMTSSAAHDSVPVGPPLVYL